MAEPLEGLLVVAVEQAVAAPFCTSRLADAGARVIKVERPDGDFARNYDGAAETTSSYFAWLNRGKESIALDLRRPEAVSHLSAIIARADVLVQNLKPGAMERLNLSMAALRQRHPRLICCSISGYGESGPYSQRKAYDLLVQADSGLASITGSGEDPARVGISVVDIATGLSAYSAILEALIERGRTGQGSEIQVSMFGVIAEWLTVPLLNAEAGSPPQRRGLSHPSIAPYGTFLSADDVPILLSIQNDREWRTFCNNVLGYPQLAEDTRFSTNLARVKNRAETDELVSKFFRSNPADRLTDRLLRDDIAFATINSIEQLSGHPHLRRITVQTSKGAVSMPAPGVVLSGRERRYGAVPSIGQHTQEIVEEFDVLNPHQP